jgi:hypothetical protein
MGGLEVTGLRYTHILGLYILNKYAVFNRLKKAP